MGVVNEGWVGGIWRPEGGRARGVLKESERVGKGVDREGGR